MLVRQMLCDSFQIVAAVLAMQTMIITNVVAIQMCFQLINLQQSVAQMAFIFAFIVLIPQMPYEMVGGHELVIICG